MEREVLLDNDSIEVIDESELASLDNTRTPCIVIKSKRLKKMVSVTVLDDCILVRSTGKVIVTIVNGAPALEFS